MFDMRHKVEGNFIRVTQRRVPGMIQRCTGTHVGRHGGTSKKDAFAKAITERILCVDALLYFFIYFVMVL